MSTLFGNSFFEELTARATQNNRIDPLHFETYDICRGLRHKNGAGVRVGVTNISSVQGYRVEDGERIPTEGTMLYRGIDLQEMVHGFQQENRRGFEETAYLLLFGELPDRRELASFNAMLDANRELPPEFTENMILKIPSRDVMNKLQRSILVLYSHDENPDEASVRNALRQSIQLIARFPTIIAYGYQAKAHYYDNKSLFIHQPMPGIGTAENILRLIRPDNQYTNTEAELLDLCLVMHAEHGGGNNSAFATHVVASSGTDTYSVIAAAVGSLKGPKHGGASNKVRAMVTDIRQNCSDCRNKDKLRAYLRRILRREVFDREGLIYGMGHAVYTLSDPRAQILKDKALVLAAEKQAEEEFDLFHNIETISTELLRDVREDHLPLSANVDLYSGFIYGMLGIPDELHTPLFAAARIAGWCAHRLEQIVSDNRIMRPSYVGVHPGKRYTPLQERASIS